MTVPGPARRRRRRIAAMAAAISSLSLVVAWRLSGDHSVEAVEAFGPLRLGQKVPSFAAVSARGKDMGPTTPGGAFYVHVVDDRLPSTCLNEECGGDAASAVVGRGGVLMGFSDGKAARAMGVELASTKPWRFRTSLVVVADRAGVVSSIHPGARLDSVVAIVEGRAR